MSRLELVSVTKRFPGGIIAVDDVTLTVEDGELFVIVGPSGAGKSTVLNLLVGLEDLTEGTIKVDGKVVNNIEPHDREMAMVFQGHVLYPHMTVRQNLAFPLKVARVPGREVVRRVNEVADLLGLTGLLARKPNALSGGQRQQVAVGRAIIRRPKVFLMDEPLSDLDAATRVTLRAQLAELQNRLGVTTVLVTHDQAEAMTLGHRVAVLRDGVVEQVGSPRALYGTPHNRFVAEFLGSPPMNLLTAEVADGQVHTPLASLLVPASWARQVPSNGGEVTVGIRPEHFSTTPAGRGHGGVETASASASLSVRIDLVEWSGADAYAYFSVDALAEGDHGERGRSRLCARVAGADDLRSGQEITLWFDSRDLQVFDAESGRSLLVDKPRSVTIDLDAGTTEGYPSLDERLTPLPSEIGTEKRASVRFSMPISESPSGRA